MSYHVALFISTWTVLECKVISTETHTSVDTFAALNNTTLRAYRAEQFDKLWQCVYYNMCTAAVSGRFRALEGRKFASWQMISIVGQFPSLWLFSLLNQAPIFFFHSFKTNPPSHPGRSYIVIVTVSGLSGSRFDYYAFQLFQ